MFYLKRFYEYIGFVQGPFVGCTAQTVRALEQQLGIRFPEAYGEYLIFAGEEAGHLFCEDCTAASLLPELQQEARDILARCGQAPLPGSFLVFLTHQNYSMYALDLTTGDDPAVYLFVEPEAIRGWQLAYATFSACVEAQIDARLEALGVFC
ncbi:SMI1/KNR4 family protein [Hymenobacter metallicola]|uniref:Knr4/Smi1-like domain-containing protein n=1 Tax=Hymenobacter metallicola TaxID=2563114 RepID=A0A4Z0QCC8_9BACT|nr:SMI1/KNR4 family protein [Hymenobacter metallicola]TGE27717.1 hypothetical protein E5K02_15235 [Hymenobacter metallicola]